MHISNVINHKNALTIILCLLKTEIDLKYSNFNHSFLRPASRTWVSNMESS